MRPNHIDMQHNNINVLHVDRKLYEHCYHNYVVS